MNSLENWSFRWRLNGFTRHLRPKFSREFTPLPLTTLYTHLHGVALRASAALPFAEMCIKSGPIPTSTCVLANLKFASSEYEDLSLDLWSLATEGTQESDKRSQPILVTPWVNRILGRAKRHPAGCRAINAYTHCSRIINSAERQKLSMLSLLLTYTDIGRHI